MGRSIKLPDLPVQRVHLSARFELGNLGFQLGLLGGDSPNRGFAKSDPSMQIPWGLFPCEQFINPARRRPPGTVFLRGD
jgi:hypothetical protein